jgi:hypothetical protein
LVSHYGSALKDLKPAVQKLGKKDLGQKLKLNLSEIKHTKSSRNSSVVEDEEKEGPGHGPKEEVNGEDDALGMLKISSETEEEEKKKKFIKRKIDPGEEFLAKMKKMGEAWKKKQKDENI